MDQSTDLRYPIGEFKYEESSDPERKKRFISEIEETPELLRKAVEKLNNEQLDTPYRPGGWTVRQVIHHIPDSHLNAYVRFKLALTEDLPTIKPYEEARWAELKDAFDTPVEVSLDLLKNLHKRWVILLRSMSDVDYRRTFNHPESGKMDLNKLLALYAWHSKHHLAHITSLKERMGWK